MMPLMLCQELKNQITKVNQTVRQSCSNLKEVLYVISFHFEFHRKRLGIETYLVLKGVA